MVMLMLLVLVKRGGVAAFGGGGLSRRWLVIWNERCLFFVLRMKYFNIQ
jgi:hypothetical protein